MLRIMPIMVLMLCLLSGCINTDSSSSNAIGVVDTARAFRDSNAGKAGSEFLKNLNNAMQAELNKFQASLGENPEDEILQQRLQAVYMELQQNMNAEQQSVVNTLNNALEIALNKIREAKKLSVLVPAEGILSYSTSIDVTADVIAELNKQSVEFKRITPEEIQSTKEPLPTPDKKEEKKEDSKNEKK